MTKKEISKLSMEIADAIGELSLKFNEIERSKLQEMCDARSLILLRKHEMVTNVHNMLEISDIILNGIYDRLEL